MQATVPELIDLSDEPRRTFEQKARVVESAISGDLDFRTSSTQLIDQGTSSSAPADDVGFDPLDGPEDEGRRDRVAQWAMAARTLR